MGGYGAVKLALRKPWLFAFAASTSGAFHAARLVGKPEIEDWNELMPSIEKAFGPCGSRERLVNDIFTLVSRFDVDKQVPPAIKLDCGKDDSFLGINRAFSKTLAAKGIFHSYKEYKGGHDWPYWNRRIKDILKDADDILK